MQLPSLHLAASALLAQVASSAYLLSNAEPHLQTYGFAGIYNRGPTPTVGFFGPGWTSLVEIGLDADGHLPGRLKFYQVADGEWEFGYGPSIQGGRDISGPFAIEAGRFVYKGEGGGVWNACFHEPKPWLEAGYSIVLSASPSPRRQCIFKDVILKASEFE